jgi:DNA-binding NarL/FixJ family response regulator
LRGSTEQRTLQAVRPVAGEESPRVMIAVADDLYRLGLTRLLREHSVEIVAHVPSAHAATEVARALEPDVVLLELRPPRSSALAIARLCNLEPSPRVLALSSSPNHGEAVEALCAGASGYLGKHADAGTFAGAIRALSTGDVLMPWFVADNVLAPLRETRRPPRAEELADEPLSAREVQVLGLVAQGKPNEEIAHDLVVTASTVKNHVTRIVAKLGARNRTHAAVLAVQRRYV